MDQASITRALSSLPPGDGARDRVWPKLVVETHDDGAFPKFDQIKSVGDIRSIGIAGLSKIGIESSDAEWLLAQFGGAKRGRKKGN